MGYEYIQERTRSITVDTIYDVHPIARAVSDILENSRHVLEVHVVRDEKDLTVFHIIWTNLEHGVTC